MDTLAAPADPTLATSPDATAGWITVTGAHLHNLRHVSTRLPRGRLVAFTGISGSGKSSLAFGSLHGEAQRRYLESIAPFARRLIGSAISPQVEAVHGLPPTVALEQRRSSGGARSTVGTVTSLSNTIRLLYSRVGDHPADVLERGSALHSGRLTSDTFSPNTTDGMCPTCHGEGVVRTPTEQSMIPDPSRTIRGGAVAPWPGAWLGKNFRDILATLGVDVDAPWSALPQETRDWILFTAEQPVVTVRPVREPDTTHLTYEGKWQSVERYLRHTATSGSDRVRRRALSFMHSATCPTCDGRRLHPDALRVGYLGEPIDALMTRPASDLLDRLAARQAEVDRIGPDTAASTPESEAERLLLPNVTEVLGSIVGLGLGHLALARGARTLSTGELQRVRLAGQLRAGLFGVAYVLDEPSAGLHPSEKGALLDLLERLLAEGNSVLMVEHDMALVERADWVVDVGPGAGTEGGEILCSGPVPGLHEVAGSATARYLGAPAPSPRGAGDARTPSGTLELTGVTSRMMKDLDVELPLGAFTTVSGVSGAGKTSLIEVIGDVLRGHVRTAVVDEPEPADAAAGPEPTDAPDGGAAAELRIAAITGTDSVDRLVRISQRPIGRSPRSCLATYTGLFDRVRRLFAGTEEARRRGWRVGRFSFNVTAGRCPVCDGAGQVEVELVFLPGSYATCPACHGRRYRDETLEITWNGLTIADVLDLPVAQALDVFAAEPRILRALTALDAVGLGYLTLGQPATELSGGEAQRIKLATELQRAARGHTVYLLDEPTNGLHPADVDLLVTELNRLVDAGNTVVVAEHDLRVVAQSDHVLELGPGAGADGGRIVAQGTPAEIATTDTATGRCLRVDGPA